MKKRCPAFQGYLTRRGETTRPPELPRPPRRVCNSNVNGCWILQRNKLKVTSSRVTRGEGCLGHPRPYIWGINRLEEARYCLFIRRNARISRTEFVYTINDKRTLDWRCWLIFVLPGYNNLYHVQINFYAFKNITC